MAAKTAAALFGHGKVLETVQIVAGKLSKEVIVAGTGTGCPPPGANVKAHYVGKLQTGQDFDSSRKRGRPFVFDIGQGKVIKGWDVGIATMLKGEKSVFTISSDYGYGAAGAGGVIPPNATLVFEVELLEVRWPSLCYCASHCNHLIPCPRPAPTPPPCVRTTVGVTVVELSLFFNAKKKALKCHQRKFRRLRQTL